MDVSLKYGDGGLRFHVPAERVGQVIRAGADPTDREALPGLAEAVREHCAAAVEDVRNREILVLLADATREQPRSAVCSALVPLLRLAASVRVLLATGTHRADTPENRRLIAELKQTLAAEQVPLASVEAHDCHASRCEDAGITDRGNRVRLNERVAQAGAILIASDMRPHYFAGYSNATKYLLPGAAAFESIERNHALALDPGSTYCRHPLHPDPARRENPVAEDVLDAARLVTRRMPVWALTWVGAAGRVALATFGPLEEAVARGIVAADEHRVATVDRAYRYAVIGCGGYPHDETLYIAQRSLELTREAVADRGEVLWLAECRNGVASCEGTTRSFFTPLKADPEGYVRRVRRRYVMFSHKTVRFVEQGRRLAALHVVSELPRGRLPAGPLIPCADPQHLVDAWAAEGQPILFVDDANVLAVMLRARNSE
jgi:nickel-dependent lactate racemase